MMPEDLWAPLSDHEVRSLVAYLASPGAGADARHARERQGASSTAATWPAGTATPSSGRSRAARSSAGPPAWPGTSSSAPTWPLGDFRLTLNVKLVENEGNSGIQFRSEPLPDGEVKGYQADVGPGWWGKLYEENGRGLLWKESGEAARQARRVEHLRDPRRRPEDPDLHQRPALRRPRRPRRGPPGDRRLPAPLRRARPRSATRTSSSNSTRPPRPVDEGVIFARARRADFASSTRSNIARSLAARSGLRVATWAIRPARWARKSAWPARFWPAGPVPQAVVEGGLEGVEVVAGDVRPVVQRRPRRAAGGPPGASPGSCGAGRRTPPRSRSRRRGRGTGRPTGRRRRRRRRPGRRRTGCRSPRRRRPGRRAGSRAGRRRGSPARARSAPPAGGARPGRAAGPARRRGRAPGASGRRQRPSGTRLVQSPARARATASG